MTVVALGEMVDFVGGGTPSKDESLFWGGDIPWVSVKDLKSKVINETIDTITPQGVEGSSTRVIEKGALIIATRMAVGKAVILGVDAAINQDLKAVRIKGELDRDYLFYFLKQAAPYFERVSTGATVKGIKLEHLRNLEIPLPPLEEQKRIAGILDEADRVRKKTQALIDKYDELAQSLFLDMFGDPVTNPKGWEVKPLGKLAHLKAGKFVRASDISEECDEGMHPCYGGNGLRGFVESTTHEGEFVLIGRQGALCGNVKLVKGLFHATEHAVVCTPSLSYESEWFYHLLVMLDLNRFATGAAQPGLNVGTLNEVSVPYPPQELQQSFSLMIKNLTAQKELTDQGAQESQEIFQALLQKAFKGELT